ncbi:MAG: DNA-3-methyladenine glycosylase [Gemmatimonadaceae bacterium]
MTKEDAAPTARRSRFGPSPVLPRAFYARDPAVVARALLGAILECHTAEGVARGRIVETEAYLHADDPASHSHGGPTPRNAAMFGPPGNAYVYFIYGVHWCFNAVTREAGHGSAVLVRALEPLDGLELMRARRSRARGDVALTNGPGKLCQALGITGAMDGRPLQRRPLLIRAGDPVPDARVRVGPRIGIRKAADLPLRFWTAGSPFVSRR